MVLKLTAAAGDYLRPFSFLIWKFPLSFEFRELRFSVP